MYKEKKRISFAWQITVEQQTNMMLNLNQNVQAPQMPAWHAEVENVLGENKMSALGGRAYTTHNNARKNHWILTSNRTRVVSTPPQSLSSSSSSSWPQWTTLGWGWHKHEHAHSLPVRKTWGMSWPHAGPAHSTFKHAQIYTYIYMQALTEMFWWLFRKFFTTEANMRAQIREREKKKKQKTTNTTISDAQKTDA